MKKKSLLLILCVLSHFSPAQLSATPWTLAHQEPLSMGFFRQKYWSGLLYPPPGDLPDPGIKPTVPKVSCPFTSRFFTTSTTWEAHIITVQDQFLPIGTLI